MYVDHIENWFVLNVLSIENKFVIIFLLDLLFFLFFFIIIIYSVMSTYSRNTVDIVIIL